MGLTNLLLFGDSLTAGKIGIGYSQYLPVQKQVHGIDGDTCLGVMDRAIAHLGRRGAFLSKALVIQGGANDLLIPHMARQDTRWASAAADLMHGNQMPIEDDHCFLPLFQESLETLKTAVKGCLVVFCAVPPLGENLESALNHRRTRRNTLMRSLVVEKGFLWCDIARPLETLIGTGLAQRGQTLPSDYLLGEPCMLSSDSQYIRGDERKAFDLSLQRSLTVTIDGVHTNAWGAQAIAQALELFLPY
ncbi:MAG: SGNH/GDSL hydrolase family protein [Sphaerochaetaceae bacterium]